MITAVGQKQAEQTTIHKGLHRYTSAKAPLAEKENGTNQHQHSGAPLQFNKAKFRNSLGL